MIEIGRPLSDEDFRSVAKLAATDPTKWLDPHWRVDDWVPDLEFLRHFPTLERLYLPLHSGRDIEALKYVPRLTHLRLDKYKHRVSLSPLAALRELAWVQLESHKHAEVLCDLPSLQAATLIKLDMGKRFTGLANVREAVVVQCKYPVVPPMPLVERLRVSYGKAEDGLASLGSMTHLQRLSITCIKTLEALPDLSALAELRELTLYDLRGLTDIQAIASIPGLTTLVLNQLPVISAEALDCIKDHPTLEKVDLRLGDDNESNRGKQLLGLELTGLRRSANGVTLVEREPGSYALSIRDVQMSWEVFEDTGHLPNGHTWARLAGAFLSDKPASWRRAVTLDAEADGFYATSDHLRSISSVYTRLSALAGDDDALRGALAALD